MRKTIGEMQDRILAGYDKENKRGTATPKLPTLAEQLKELEDWKKLTPSEKYKKMQFRDWEDLLEKFLVDEHRVCTPRQFAVLIMGPKTRAQFFKFKEEGTDFQTIKDWTIVNNPDRW
jgi:hypothetical protein